MKYWNKQISARRHWHTVTLSPDRWYQFDELKVWCQRHSSTARFFSNIGSSDWVFESQADAVVFKLTWGSGINKVLDRKI